MANTQQQPHESNSNKNNIRATISSGYGLIFFFGLGIVINKDFQVVSLAYFCFVSVLFYGHVCDKAKTPTEASTETEMRKTEVEEGKLPISTMSLKKLNFNFDKGPAKERMKQKNRQPSCENVDA